MPYSTLPTYPTLTLTPACFGLTMDEHGCLYVTDDTMHSVRRYRMGETNGTAVAGGHGRGDSLNQLDYPSYIYVDEEQTVYVAERYNHRVVKWDKDAKEGILVAGNGDGEGKDFTHLSYPKTVFADSLGAVYVLEGGNNRVTRWSTNSSRATVVVGRHGEGSRTDQFNQPIAFSFDRDRNIYVVDHWNHRVQRFSIDLTR